MEDYERRCMEREQFYRNHRLISADDPNALSLLRQKLDYLEAEREDMKRLNAIYRKSGWEGLKSLGNKALAQLKRSTAITPYAYERCVFSAWELSNTYGQLKQVKERIAELESRDQLPPAEPIKIEGCEMVEDKEDNRIHLLFDTKPSEAIRQVLKSNGFKWSPNRSAWIRRLNNEGRYKSKVVLEAMQNLRHA